MEQTSAVMQRRRPMTGIQKERLKMIKKVSENIYNQGGTDCPRPPELLIMIPVV